MVIKSAEYLTSVVSIDKIIQEGIDFAFVGRSNVGKSSLINSLTGQNKLCKTSSTPGRTRMINYFLVNNQFRLVDLPGYGYAAVSGDTQKKWSDLLEYYLVNTKTLKRVFMLVDCRITPTLHDKQMFEFLSLMQLPFTIIATKCDKISRAQLGNNIQNIAKTLNIGKDNIIPYSSEKGTNKNKVLQVIENSLSN